MDRDVGWSYDHRQDMLYDGVRPAERPARYASEFSTVELNSSFYRWARGSAFRA
ncbi:MAG: hypothetical protein M0Z51_00790 [Propionibacterium sp.]|nr:hypothetical protein [Propionibacterium sp.]